VKIDIQGVNMEQKKRQMPNNTSNITRRRFLAGSAGAASFFIMKPSIAFGTRANSRIQVGCIGLGERGTWIAEYLSKHRGYQITAVADYFQDSAQKAGRRHKLPASRQFSGLSGYKKLLESRIEAAFCITPPVFLPEHTASAIEAGCHVYMAKPVAIDTAGCQTVRETGQKATQNKKVFQVDFQTRTDPYYIEAIKRVHQGDLEKVSLLRVFCASDGWDDPPKTKTIESRLRNGIWINDVNLSGGWLIAYDVHGVDVASWIAQANPVSAMGSARLCKKDKHGDTEDVYSVTYQYANGLIMNHLGEHLKNMTESPIQCFAYGYRGYLETNYGGKVWIRSDKKPYRGGLTSNIYAEGMNRNVETFYQNIVKGDYTNPTVKTSVDSTLTCVLGREAARNNTQVTWDELLRNNHKIETDFTGLRQ
jgi:myo-inositol 2-dehydrogenase/D-chiro-inositol 1-dehydrogenase